LIGIIWKVIPVASGFFFAVGNPDLSTEINEKITPIGIHIKDGVLGFLTYIGGLIA